MWWERKAIWTIWDHRDGNSCYISHYRLRHECQWAANLHYVYDIPQLSQSSISHIKKSLNSKKSSDMFELLERNKLRTWNLDLLLIYDFYIVNVHEESNLINQTLIPSNVSCGYVDNGIYTLPLLKWSSVHKNKKWKYSNSDLNHLYQPNPIQNLIKWKNGATIYCNLIHSLVVSQ